MCGEVHELRIHGYPGRCVRNRERQYNERIRVVVIRCENARAAGKQYTKRVLPDFLIPGCVIRLDHVEQAYKERRRGAGNEQLCRILGCIDDRTVRGHLRRYGEAIEAVTLRLAEKRAMTPELGELPGSTPETSAVERLEDLWRAEVLASRRSGNAADPSGLRYLFQAVLGKSGLKKPSGCVFADARAP